MISDNMDQVKQRENNGFCSLNVKELKDIFRNTANPGPPAPGPYKPTCVFLLLFNFEEPHILAIQKTDSEGYPWRNQVALPGGHLEDEDASPLEGAYRELEEETKISRNQVELIGSLGHYQTINGRDIEAFTGVWDATGPVRHDPSEISRILKIPLGALVQTHHSNNFHNRIPSIDELRYPFEDVVIWGATARMLHHFIEQLYPLFGSIPSDKAYDVGDNQAST
jgi:8-oxo-dGTP pyrophosphatase MutT (NUDIX family)